MRSVLDLGRYEHLPHCKENRVLSYICFYIASANFASSLVIRGNSSRRWWVRSTVYNLRLCSTLGLFFYRSALFSNLFREAAWCCDVCCCFWLLLGYPQSFGVKFRNNLDEDNGTNLKFEFHEWYPPVVTCTSQVRVTTWDTVCIVAVTTKRRNLSFFQKRFWQRPLKLRWLVDSRLQN